MTKVLYIGGTGEISYACLHEAVRIGQHVTVYNRGSNREPLPEGVQQIVGDVNDDKAYDALAKRDFDVVCQYRLFGVEAAQRDIDMFAGHCGQFIFISSASAYQKPCRDYIITEETPLDNPFWEYSRKKAAIEKLMLAAHATGKLPVTIVRPSHTHRSRFPGTFMEGDHIAWRILRGKPVIVHGDGQSLWTVTHSQDYARAFVRLCGLKPALGEAYHITRDRAHTWDVLLHTIGDVIGKAPIIRHIASDALIRYQPQWAGPLHGDKTNSVVFDNSKVSSAVGGWRCELSMEQGLAMAGKFVKQRLEAGYTPNPESDALIDRIIAEHDALGA